MRTRIMLLKKELEMETRKNKVEKKLKSNIDKVAPSVYPHYVIPPSEQFMI